jgi:hypothetical protein
MVGTWWHKLCLAAIKFAQRGPTFSGAFSRCGHGCLGS